MCKCRNCGNLFEPGEAAIVIDTHGLDCPPYESYFACPVCHSGDFEETEHCCICGAERTDDEMYGSACDQCIDELIDVSHFYSFGIDGFPATELDYVEDFVYGSLFGLDWRDYPRYSTAKMKLYLHDLFMHEAATDSTGEVMEKIRKYMSAWSIRDEFAEWLEMKRGEKNVY